MPGEIYDASEVIDKNLITLRALPYYDGVPSGGTPPKQLGTFPAGANAGMVYSWIDPDPSKGRPDLWWMFYPGVYGRYYYMPHHQGDFDPKSLEQQGATSEDDKNSTWYEKLLKQILPVVAITVIGAAAVRGYFSRK